MGWLARPCTREGLSWPWHRKRLHSWIHTHEHTHTFIYTYRLFNPLWHQSHISPQRYTKVLCLLFINPWFWGTSFISQLLKTVLSNRDSFYSQIQEFPSFVAHSLENQLIVWTSTFECFFRSYSELNVLSNSFVKNCYPWALLCVRKRREWNEIICSM